MIDTVTVFAIQGVAKMSCAILQSGKNGLKTLNACCSKCGSLLEAKLQMSPRSAARVCSDSRRPAQPQLVRGALQFIPGAF